MISGKTIAFHSYKGGTGKTTLISNLSALYAMSGMKIGLLDFDLYAPSLGMYFRKKPTNYLNNLLRGEIDKSNGEVDPSLVVVDVSSELGLKGKLFIGFSSPSKEDISEIEFRHEQKWQLQAIKRFQAFKNQLFEEYELDYLFLDTSPGIRYWSINTLAMANMLFLVMKNSDMDIEGTRKMIDDIYEVLTRYGKSKYFIVLNKVPGGSDQNEVRWEGEEKAWESELEGNLRTQVVGTIPCFCDIQFNKHEFLYAINHPEHPFSKKVDKLAERIKGLS